MAFTGDIAAMGLLANRIRDLADVPSRAAAAVSVALEALIEDEFAGGHDPYGKPWKPLAEATIAKGRHAPPLTDTGAMRASAHVAALRGAGVGISIDHPAAPHMTGYVNAMTGRDVPARPMLPKGVMPATWRAAIREAVGETFRK